MSDGATYMRDPVPADRVGQCPCCLKQHRSTKRGTLARHGWKETGRRVGEVGCGFQWGACRGSAMRPLEQTDADAIVILRELEAHLASARERLTHHEQNGEESYAWSYQRNVGSGRCRGYEWIGTDAFEAAIRELGLTVETRTDRVRRKLHRVYYEDVKVWDTKVTRGFAGAKITRDKITGKSYDEHFTETTVPSYDDLRDQYVRALRDTIGDLERQRKAIEKAAEHHRANPSSGSEDTQRRGPVVHWRWPVYRMAMINGVRQRVARKVVACGSRAMAPVTSETPSEVTCSRCQKKLPKWTVKDLEDAQEGRA